METKIKITGMSCNHCTGRVEKYLKEQKGLSNIVVDLDNAQAKFVCEPGVDVDALVKGITDLGYPASKE